MIEVDFAFPENVSIRRQRRYAIRLGIRYFIGVERDIKPEQEPSVFPAAGRGRYYRDELLAAFEWVRRMRPDMNEKQHARMIKIRCAYEYTLPQQFAV